MGFDIDWNICPKTLLIKVKLVGLKAQELRESSILRIPEGPKKSVIDLKVKAHMKEKMALRLILAPLENSTLVAYLSLSVRLDYLYGKTKTYMDRLCPERFSYFEGIRSVLLKMARATQMYDTVGFPEGEAMFHDVIDGLEAEIDAEY